MQCHIVRPCLFDGPFDSTVQSPKTCPEISIGLLMPIVRRRTDFIVVHASATKPAQDIGAAEIRRWHVEDRGFDDIGYNQVIRRSGAIELGRPLHIAGAHARGYNSVSVAVCLVGGLNPNGRPEDNFTDAQYEALRKTLVYWNAIYPAARILGHRDLSPDLDGDVIIEPEEWLKDCPCFSVADRLEQWDLMK